MTYPTVNNVYEYNGETVVVWGNDIFANVFCKTYSEDNINYNSIFIKYNWWKFALHAKFIKKLPKISSAY